MKKLYFFYVFLALLLPQNLLSQSGIYESYVIIDSGFGNNHYDLNPHTQTAFFDFQIGSNNPSDLGTFQSTDTFILNGGQNNVYKCGTDDITSGWLNYRIYLTGSPSGTFTGIDLSSTVNNFPLAACGGTGDNQHWITNNANINILNGLTPGFNYTIEVYSISNFSVGGVPNGFPHTVNDGGLNFRATFMLDDPPSAVCTNYTAQLDATGNVTIVGSDVDGGSTDDFGIASLSVSPNSFTCADVGANVVVLTVTDTTGQTDTCNATVTVEDNIDPSITCAANQSQTADPASCDAVVTVTAPATGDNCGVASVVNDYNGTANASDTYPVGTTTIIWTVTDVNGNSAQCSQDITVTDDEDPSITCAANQTQTADPASCDAAVTVTAPATGDNCGVASVVNDYNGTANASDTYPVGTTTITWTVTDIHGNSAQCSQDITVTDDEDPSITCAADQSQTADPASCDAVVTVTAPATGDNCGVASVVNDYNGTANASDTYPVGTTTITWTVTDVNGNSDTCTQDITVTDDEDPSITCAANQTQTADPASCDAVVTVTAPATGDNCGVASVVNDYNGTANASDTYPVGTTTITWTVTDVNGNSDTCTQDITVTDDEDPSITCAANQSQTADPASCDAAVTVTAPATGDNCGVASVVNDYNGTANASDTYPVGTTTITWTVTDIHGNSAQCTQDITVTDDEDPTITCPSDVVVSTDAGTCDATGVALGSASTTDNCPGETAANNAPATFPIGLTVVTWTVTDAAGNTASCTQNVTVNDTEDPTISCPADITVSNDPGDCSAVVNYTAPVGADNCAGQSTVQIAGLPSGSAFPVGTTTNTFEVTDAAGNTAQCSFDVTVNDTEDPTISCPSDITVNNNGGLCSAVVTYSVTSTDNCPGQTITQTVGLASGSAFPVGTTLNTFRVTDAAGNFVECSFNVTVNDTEDPTISCPADITVSNDPGDCSAVVNYTAPVGADNCAGQSTLQIAGLPSGSAFPVGTTTNTFVVTDASGNTATCSFDVTVNDSENPTITCPADITVSNDGGLCSAVVTYSVTSTDNCPGQTITQTVGLASGSAFPVGTTLNTFRVTDAAGNFVECSFNVTVNDTEDPTISCPADITVSNDPGDCSAVVNYTAPVGADNCAGQSTLQIAGLPSGSAFPVGTTTNTFVVTDASGNTATCSFDVTVNDSENPTITCPADITVNNDGGLCSAVVTYSVTSTDNCPGQTITQTVGLASGSAFPVGTTLNTFRVTDAAGNFVECSFNVTVNDTEDPTISCPADITVSNDPGDCSAVVNYTAPVGADNCAGQSTLQIAGLPSGSAFPVGTTTNTFEVTDAAGNTAQCSFDVTVNDTEDPTISCPSDITVNNDGGLCSAVVTYSVTSTDNCPGQTITQTVGLASGSAFPVGTTLNTFRVTDAAGNFVECSFNVTVNDTEDPTISCPADITVSNDPGDCSAVVNYTAPVGADNCAGQSTLQIAGLPSGSAFPVGTTTNTFEVTDAAGNTATCSFDVTVNDSENPTITCPADITVSNDGGLCSAVVTYSVTSTDNCPGQTITQTVGLASGSAFPVGTTLNTFRVTDAAGNFVECSFNVTVNDTEDPTISCPADITVSNDPGDCSAVVNYTAPVGADNCAGQSTVQIAGLPSGSAFPVGTTTNTFEVTDAAGNTAQCSFDVTVNDTEDPTISCPSDITVNNDGGLCSAVVTYSVTSTDNCPGQTITQTVGLASGSAFPVGTTLNTFRVTDAAGNFVECSFNVTVNDTEDPTISCPADITVSNDPGDCSAVVNYTAPVGADNCAGQSTVQIAGLPSGSAFPVGTTTNTFVVTDAAGNTATCSFTVTVNDTENPTITCPSDITVSNDAGDCSAVVTYSVTSTDNCAGQTVAQTAGIASGGTFPVGTTTNTFVVTDASGNTATCSFTVTVNDTENPTITCPSDITVSNDSGNCSAVVTYSVTSTDNCAGQTVAQTAGIASGGTFPVGTTTNTFEVTDAAGNTAQCSFDVTVNDTENPTITCPSDITVSNDAGDCSAVVTYSVTSTDNCAGQTVAQTAGIASGGTFPVGTTTNTFVVTDATGNTATCSFTVTVNDTENPTITCPSDITVSNDAGDCSAVVTYSVTSTDNCAGQTVAQTAGIASGGTFPVGTTTNTFVVTDATGNTATCSFTVTVNDTENPTITCPSDITVSNDAGNCSAVVIYSVTSTDNCAGQTVAQTAGIASGGTFPVGTTTNTFVVTDATGNTATCSFTVTVNDTENPTITCPSDITVSNDAGNCSAVVTYSVTSTDNCAGQTVAQTAGIASGGTFPVGTTTNTFVVTDATGNTATCSFTVTVNDTEDPTISCPSDIIVSNDAGNCSAVVTYSVTSTDNCAGQTVAQTAGIASGGTFPVGTTTNTFVVTDASGNTATCSFTVTVNDSENPTITCPSDIIVSNDAGDCSAVVTYSVTSTDNCVGQTVAQTAGIASGGTFPVGTTTNTFVVTDAAGNTATCSFDVTVNDSENPSITCAADQSQTADPASCGAAVTVSPPTTGDNCGVASVVNDYNGTANASDTYPVGTTTITWTVTDVNGNSDTCTQDITVTDNEDPTISCPANITVSNDPSDCDANVTYSVTSTDNCPGEIITQTAGIASGDPFPIGTTTNTFLVTDAAGNTATCSFTVTVNDTENPNAVCSDMTVALDPDGTINISVLDIDNGSGDNCGIANMSISPSSFDCSNLGPNTVTLTVTDSSGNVSTCTSTVTIEDTTPPDASCGSITLTLDSMTGEATITDVNALYTGSGDECSGVTLSLAQTVFGCDDLGTNSVELTITDASGNSSTCNVSVTIEAPIITSGTLTGEVVDPVPDNPIPPDDLIEVTACPGGISEPKDVELTLTLDASSTIVAANISTWQISNDNGLTWTDVAGTAGQLQHTLLDLLETTLVRVVIQSGSCIEFSPLAVIRFLPPDVPPTIVSVSATDICLGESVTVVAESFFETPGGGQWGDSGLFNHAQPEDWRVDGIDGFFPASGNNTSEPTWKETNGPTIQGGIRYDTSDNTKFAVAWGPYTTTLETPIFHTVGMDAADAILEFHQAYFFCNGAEGRIELSLDGGNTYTVTLNTMEGDVLTSPSSSGVQVTGKDGTNCGNGPNGQKPTSDPFQPASLDLGAYTGMSNLRIMFTFDGAGHAECTDTYFPPHPGNTCGNIPDEFDVYSAWVIDDVGFPYAYVDEELEWTDENGVVVATGSTVNVTPVTPGIREYGVTSLVNGCRADGDDGTEYININTSLAYAGQDFAPAGGNCGQSSLTLNAYDNTLTSVENFDNGAWETGLYVVPNIAAGDTNYLGTNVTGSWSIVASNTGACGTSETFSSLSNPRAIFTAEPGTYTLRWTLTNGCFDEVDVTITSCDEIDFDGIDDFVNFKNNYGLNATFSLEAWVKPNDVSGIRTIISKRNVTNTDNGYDFSIENGTLKFNWYTAGADGSISSSSGLTTNRWYHVAVTFDGANYLLYVDGISVGVLSGTTNPPDATTGAEDCMLGAVDQSNAANNQVTNHFSGWMDEVKIWNTALSDLQIRQMMNQEIIDNGAVRGAVVPLDIPGLNWTDLSGYYRMTVNCGYLTAYKGVRGRLRNINSSQEETAPIPYTSRVDNQNWATDNTWTEFNVWDPPHSNGIDGTSIEWNIARISHNIRSGDKNIIVLGLISDTAGKELTIADPGTAMDETNDGQSLRVTHYLKLDGDIDLIGHSQLLQDQNSALDVTSAGKLQVDQQGTPNFFNYNYWSSPVSPVNITANNTDYSVGSVLKDGTTSSNPQTISWTGSYSPPSITSPITMSRRWLFAYENYPNYVDVALSYADWRYIQETGTIATGLGFTMKGSGVGNLGDTPPGIGDPSIDYRNFVFEGKPNNGTITSPISGGYQALVGNPYSSAIDADEFIRDNIPGAQGNPGSSTSIDGTIYLWEHYETNATHELELYEGGYATYNLTGGNAAISPPLISGDGTPTKFPGRYIPVGQGFFVTATGTGGNVTFHNDQRVYVKEAVGTSVFMEANNNSMDINSNTSESEDNADHELIKRIRINGKTPEGAVRPLLLGFIPHGEATDGFDLAYDAENTDDFPNDFSWVIDGLLYTTQGVGDFVRTKQYPIGVVLSETGDIEISLLEIENFYPEIKVYLFDSLFLTYTCLNYDVFQIKLDGATYLDRFYLTFESDDTLDSSDFNTDSIFVKYLNETDELFINMPNIYDIEEVSLYNMLGQEVIIFDAQDFEYTNTTELRIPIESISEATYVVRVKTKSGVANKMVLITY